MLRLPKPHIEYLIELLPRVGRDYDLRRFDQDLWYLIDERELQVRQFTKPRMLGEERREADDALWAINNKPDAVTEEVMVLSETMEVSVDALAPNEICTTGYIDREGVFSPCPDYTVLPHYSSKTEDALRIRGVFSGRLKLEVSELPTPGSLSAPEEEWEKSTKARLITWDNELVAEHVDMSWPLAIIGATLYALIAGPELLAFNVEVTE